MESARVNLSTKRVTIRWRADGAPPPFIETLKQAGFEAHLFDVEPDDKDGALSELIRALAVAGFAASNIMLLSVSIWSGAEAETRDLFHWLSAIIALPALAYSGRIFFRSAWQALRHGRTNMDVPISIGVLLAFGMSLYETVQHGPHAYFDAAISLLFFLLIGRTLDHMMRERARLAVKGLARLAARGALVVQADGTQVYLPVSEIRTGMTIMLAAGERVPVDATVIKGISELDVSLVSGEHAPLPATIGSVLRAGTLNLTGPLTIVATATADNSFLGEMLRMMEAAEQGRSAYRRIADRAASLYAPVVHLTALADVCRLARRHRRHASRGDHRHRGSHHHLSLRARPCGADGAGGRGPAAVRERHHGEGRRRARAPRRNRHGRVRQDRNADVGRSAPGRIRRNGSRVARDRRRTGLPFPSPLFAGAGRGRRRSSRIVGSCSTKSPSIPDTDLRRTRERLPTGSAGRNGRSPTRPTLSGCRGMSPSCCAGTAAVWPIFALRTGCGRMRQRRSPN